jgi:hypothetical protein
MESVGFPIDMFLSITNAVHDAVPDKSKHNPTHPMMVKIQQSIEAVVSSLSYDNVMLSIYRPTLLKIQQSITFVSSLSRECLLWMYRLVLGVCLLFITYHVLRFLLRFTWYIIRFQIRIFFFWVRVCIISMLMVTLVGFVLLVYLYLEWNHFDCMAILIQLLRYIGRFS